MYGAIRAVLYAGGGLAIVYAIINLFGNFLYSLIGIAVALGLFYISKFVEPPQAEEAPPPDIDMTTDYRKEMVKARKAARQGLQESEKASDEEKKS